MSGCFTRQSLSGDSAQDASGPPDLKIDLDAGSGGSGDGGSGGSGSGESDGEGGAESGHGAACPPGGWPIELLFSSTGLVGANHIIGATMLTSETDTECCYSGTLYCPGQ